MTDQTSSAAAEDQATDTPAEAAAAPEATPLSTDTAIALAAAEEDKEFGLSEDGYVTYQGTPVASLIKGEHPLTPSIALIADEALDMDAAEKALERLDRFFEERKNTLLAPLVKIETTVAEGALKGAPCGLAVALLETLGALPAQTHEKTIDALNDEDKKALTCLGIRLGCETLYIPDMLKPAPARMAVTLWRTFFEEDAPLPAQDGLMRFKKDPNLSWKAAMVYGYRVADDIAVRADVLESFTAAVRAHARKHKNDEVKPPLPPETLSPAGLKAEEAEKLLRILSYYAKRDEEGHLFVGTRKKKTPKAEADHKKSGKPKKERRGKKPSHAQKTKTPPMNPEDSPFAALSILLDKK